MQNGCVCKSVCLFSVCFVLKAKKGRRMVVSSVAGSHKEALLDTSSKTRSWKFVLESKHWAISVKPAEEPFKTTETRQRHFIMLVFFSRNLYAYLLSNFTRDIKFCSERFEIYQEMVCKPAQSIIIATVL